MSSLTRLLLVCSIATLTAASAQARLGETLAEIRKQYGKPESQSRKDSAYWLFEGDNGQLLYTVTFNDKGLSIAEGLKPVKRARFNEEIAKDFIARQLVSIRDSKTIVAIPPGEKYQFAGQEFVCAQHEHIMVDIPNGYLVIWSQWVEPSVMIVAPEMFQRVK